MLKHYGNFEDKKEEFSSSNFVEGSEEEFRGLAPSHLVIQCKQ